MPLSEKVKQALRDVNISDDNNKIIAVLEDDQSVMQIDFGNPKGGNIVFEGNCAATSILDGKINEGKSFEIKTSLYYTFKEDEESGEIDLDLKDIYNFNTYKVSEFSKDTLILIADNDLRNIVQTYMKSGKHDSVIVLKKGVSSYVIPTPTEIIGKIGARDLGDMSKSQKETYEKNDLKVYETPSQMLETVMKATDYSAYDAYVRNEFGNRLYTVIASSKSLKSKLEAFVGTRKDMELSLFCRDATAYLNHHILKSYGHPVRNSTFEDDDKTKELTFANREKYEAFHEFVFNQSDNGLQDKRVMEIFEFIDEIAKNSKKDKNPFAVMVKDPEKFKNKVGRELKGKEIVFFDPQAGSASAFFAASEKVGLGDHVKLWGTELREDLDYDKNKAMVIGGVNTSLMANAMSNTFFGKKFHAAADAMLTWNNPPYSLDDGIAKASLDMYKNNTMILGLYPTKMRNYLKNTLDGQNSIIVEVPRSLTGYEDANTPERFLVVAGKKYNAEAAAREEGGGVDGVFSYSGGASIKEASLPDTATHDDLLRVLNGHFSTSGGVLGARVIKNMEYYSTRNWQSENILFKSIEESVASMKDFYQNAEKFNKIIQDDVTKKLFSNAIQPLHLAKSEKVFLDTRFYSESGEYPALNFAEVSSNVPLLLYYAKSKPKIMDIVESVAKEKNIKLPIDRSTINTELFKVGERYSGKKTKVATDKLGMMKFNFYPSDFDVQDENSRENLMRVIESIYADNDRTLNDTEKDALSKAMKASQVLTTKTENTVSGNPELEEFFVQTQECLVLEGDNHSIKLNISNFDLYNKLEEMEFFDIKDYIEVAELRSSTKEKIIEGFVEYMENVTLHSLFKHRGAVYDKNMFIEMLEESKKELHGEGMSVAQVTDKLNEKFGLQQYVESFFKQTKKMDIEKNIKPILEKYFGDDFGIGSKEGREKLAKYIGTINEFADQNKKVFFDAVLSVLLDKLKDAIREKYENEGRGKDAIRELEGRVAEAEEEMRLSLTELEKFVKETSDMTERLGMSIYYTYANLKKRTELAAQLKAQGAPEEKIAEIYENGYEKVFRNWEKNVASLMEHQIREPENFTELEDMRTNFMLKKMRTGKTLTFIFSGFLEMLTKKNDMEMYLNSANISDISSQLTQHIPMLLPSVMVFADDAKHQFIDEMSFETLYHTSAVINPLPIKGLNHQIVGGGAEIERLANNFSKEMELIEKELDKKYPNGVTLDDMLRDYKDSPFIGMIETMKVKCAQNG